MREKETTLRYYKYKNTDKNINNALKEQYKTLRPKTKALKNRLNTKATCPAREDAESESWSKNPSINASLAVTSDIIRY